MTPRASGFSFRVTARDGQARGAVLLDHRPATWRRRRSCRWGRRGRPEDPLAGRGRVDRRAHVVLGNTCLPPDVCAPAREGHRAARRPSRLHALAARDAHGLRRLSGLLAGLGADLVKGRTPDGRAARCRERIASRLCGSAPRRKGSPSSRTSMGRRTRSARKRPCASRASSARTSRCSSTCAPPAKRRAKWWRPPSRGRRAGRNWRWHPRPVRGTQALFKHRAGRLLRRSPVRAHAAESSLPPCRSTALPSAASSVGEDTSSAHPHGALAEVVPALDAQRSPDT